MALYKIYSLPIPAGYRSSVPNEINDNQVVVGWCGDGGNDRKAILWKQGGFLLLNLPGQHSNAHSLNLKQNVVGSVDNQPFIWQLSTGITTILKDFGGQAGIGRAMGINDFDQITGSVLSMDYKPVLWQASNAIPIDLSSGIQFRWLGTEGSGFDINNNEFIVGVTSNAGSFINQGFIWNNTSRKLNIFFDPGFTGEPESVLNSVNDLLSPQFVGRSDLITKGVDLPFLYDTLTASIQDLAIPGENGNAYDINNNGDAVGIISDNAVLWTLNGLVRTNLNHPTISDAQPKGWHLRSATSINNKGYIAGYGNLNGDTSQLLPWLLKPIIPIHKIPIEYILPQALWPGQAYDGPKPKGWPLKLPFPIPSPNPFQLVGNAFTHLNNILISKNVNEITKKLEHDNARKEIQEISLKVINDEMKKLKTILSKSIINQKKSVKNNFKSSKIKNK